MELISLGLGAAAVLGAAWKTGLIDLTTDYLAYHFGQFSDWVADPGGAWADLPGRLAYRDFYDDVVETQDGWMWSGVEFKPISTDGYSGSEWNVLSNRLNRIFTLLRPNTWIQIVYRADVSPREGVAVYERLYKNIKDPSLKAVLTSRIKHLYKDSRSGNLVRRRYYAFIGRQRKPKGQKIPLRSVISSKPFIDFEEREFFELRSDCLRERETFIEAFTGIGGLARRVGAQTAFEIAYQRLNPLRSLRHKTPAFLSPEQVEANSRAARQQKFIPVGRRPGQIWNDFISGLEDDGMLDPSLIKNSEEILKFTGREELFAESPRETLCFTPVHINKDYFSFGDIPVQTLTLQRLPTQTFAGLCEHLTRVAALEFPLEVVTNFKIGDQVSWDEDLERRQSRIRVNIQRSNGKPNQVEEIKAGEIYDLRQQIRKGEEKIGLLGFSVTIAAPTLDDLRRRSDRVTVALRSMEGLEVIAEPHTPLDQLLASLPCAPHSDFRTKPCLSRDAVALSALTGGTEGVMADDAIEVLHKVDGGLLLWNPASKNFNSGMSIYCGSPGSGKSGALNRQRLSLIMSGRIGISIDLGGSSFRLAKLVGGNYIDITDPAKTKGLGLFAIRPMKGEEYSPDELTPAGLPLDRLAAVQNMVEILCLDPSKPSETALPPALASFLREKIVDTYDNLVDETPTINDFMRTLKRTTKEHREKGEELAARLQIYAEQGSLGRFLNDRSDPLPLSSVYTIFDFRGAIDDKRLVLIATMAVANFISRALRYKRKIPKFLDVDEFHFVKDHALITKTLDQNFRMARKLNALVSVASQDPTDFDSEHGKGIRASSEVYWLFSMPKPEMARKIFELPIGVGKLLNRLQVMAGAHYRDCVLVYPGNCAHLRLRHNPLEQRLHLGAGREVATLQGALSDIDGPVPTRLSTALAADGLGIDEPEKMSVAVT